MSLSAKSFYGNDFDLHENETACKTHFHMKGFALRLILKQRRKRTLKWPITQISDNIALVKYPSQFSHSGVGDCSMYYYAVIKELLQSLTLKNTLFYF